MSMAKYDRAALDRRLLVRKILETPPIHNFTIQGLGMLRLYLSPEVRLHIWDPRPPHKVAHVSELHSHPWWFISTIVAGQIINHVYERVPERRADSVAWMSGTIECGPKPKKQGACDTKLIHLVHRSMTYDVGEFYAMDAATIHRSEPHPGTVTICHRKPLPDPDHATVCWPNGEEWVSAEPREASEDEVHAITRTALALMDEEDKVR